MSILGAKKVDSSVHLVSVDLRSDTQTTPCPGMREYMSQALVGDDVYGEDPTIQELEKKMAYLAGMEAGLFVPSGTMGNLISVMVHCRERGSEIILGDQSHIHLYEQGGIAQIGGIHSRTVPNAPDGTFDLDKAETLIRSEDVHYPVSRVLVIENTHNKAGGKVLPLEWIEKAHQLVQIYGLKLHCDAARIFNASISCGKSIRELLSPMCHSASICLSKGLGAPVGSVIVGSTEFIQRSRRLRKALGGGMRQIGILGSAGLFALEHNVKKLKVDHERCQALAKDINELKDCAFSCPGPDSNILMINIPKNSKLNAKDLVQRLLQVPEKESKALGNKETMVYTLEFSKKTVRLVFHLSLSEKEFDQGSAKILYVLKELSAL